MGYTRFEKAIEVFDQANGRDPRSVTVDGKAYPCELYYAGRLSHWLERLAPDASEPLRLAGRCQHIERWTVPRTNFPPGRRGYLDWRESLKKYHADRAGQILRQVGYDEQTIARVQELNLKKNIKGDAETQALEDALCLVFLEEQFHDFAEKTDKDKVLSILRKTWIKMSPRGRELALELPLDTADRSLVEQALGLRK